MTWLEFPCIFYLVGILGFVAGSVIALVRSL